jgi:hypothetical protein
MCLKTARKQMSRICEMLKKMKIKEKGEREQNHVMEKREMSQKKQQVKQKTVRLTSKTRCAQTLVTVYLVPARGVVATRL